MKARAGGGANQFAGSVACGSIASSSMWCAGMIAEIRIGAGCGPLRRGAVPRLDADGTVVAEMLVAITARPARVVEAPKAKRMSVGAGFGWRMVRLGARGGAGESDGGV